MTDTAHRPLSDAQLDAIAALDVNLDDESSVLAADRDRAEDAAIERRKAEAREEFAEAARKAASERADLAEQCARQLLAAHYIGPAADDEGLPCPEGEDLTAIAETLYEDWVGGVALADLDARALVRGWADGRPVEYGPDGFTPVNCEVPF